MQTKEVQSEFYTIHDMRRLFGGVHRVTIWRWERKGKLPKRTKFGLWCKSDVDNIVAECCNMFQLVTHDDFSR